MFPKREVPLGEIALELRNVSCAAAGLRDISLSVRQGEILGLAGLVGSGRTELAETIFGLTPADSGEILVRGKSVRIQSPAQAIQLGIGYVPEDRREHGIILEMPIAANTSLANLSSVSHWGWIDEEQEEDLAQRYIGQLGIKTASAQMEAGSLSGGNQQKVALARWLAIDPKILILDEPTQGVDVGSKSEIHSLMVDLAGRGMAIILISSELPEILGMSDRIAVMHAGRISGVLSRQEATQQRILTLCVGESTMIERHSREIAVAGTILALFAVLAFRAPAYFSRGESERLFLANVPVLIVALGMTLIILTGEIDVSVGSMFAIAGVVAGMSGEIRLARAGSGFSRLYCGRRDGSGEWRAGGLPSRAFHRGHARGHGCSAGRTPMDHPGRLGGRSAWRLSMARALAIHLSAGDVADCNYSCGGVRVGTPESGCGTRRLCYWIEPRKPRVSSGMHPSPSHIFGFHDPRRSYRIGGCAQLGPLQSNPYVMRDWVWK